MPERSRQTNATQDEPASGGRFHHERATESENETFSGLPEHPQVLLYICLDHVNAYGNVKSYPKNGPKRTNGAKFSVRDPEVHTLAEAVKESGRRDEDGAAKSVVKRMLTANGRRNGKATKALVRDMALLARFAIVSDVLTEDAKDKCRAYVVNRKEAWEEAFSAEKAKRRKPASPSPSNWSDFVRRDYDGLSRKE